MTELEKKFMEACQTGNLKIVENCIKQGVNINVKEKLGKLTKVK